MAWSIQWLLMRAARGQGMNDNSRDLSLPQYPGFRTRRFETRRLIRAVHWESWANCKEQVVRSVIGGFYHLCARDVWRNSTFLCNEYFMALKCDIFSFPRYRISRHRIGSNLTSPGFYSMSDNRNQINKNYGKFSLNYEYIAMRQHRKALIV